MSTEGSLNWLQCSVPEADAQMDKGLNTTDKQVVQDSYAKAGDLLVDSGCFITIADAKEVIVAKKLRRLHPPDAHPEHDPVQGPHRRLSEHSPRWTRSRARPRLPTSTGPVPPTEASQESPMKRSSPPDRAATSAPYGERA
jgi:hypothetical protein